MKTTGASLSDSSRMGTTNCRLTASGLGTKAVMWEGSRRRTRSRQARSSISVFIDKRGLRVNNARKFNRTLHDGQIADHDWAHFVQRYLLMTFALIPLRPSALRREVIA